MTSSRSSKGGIVPESRPPRFFADRCLGKLTVERLRSLGWDIITIGEVFADDAQGVDDPDWIEHGCEQGWAGLTKDKRIRRQVGFQRATKPIFALSSGQVNLQQMVERFDAARTGIWAHAHASMREFWIVYENGRIERTHPPR